MVKRAEDMVKLYNEHMRGGDGTVEIIRYLEPEEFRQCENDRKTGV